MKNGVAIFSISPRFSVLLVFSLTLWTPDPGLASAKSASPKSSEESNGLLVASLEVGEAKVLQLKGPVQKVFVGDPKVVDARPNSDKSIVLVAKGPGNTTLIASNDDGDIVGKYYVIVSPANGVSRRAQAKIRSMDGNDVNVTPMVGGVHVSGEVDSASQAEEAVNAAADDLPEGSVVRNDLRIKDSVQVNLRVRIVEMSRQLTRALGVNWKNLGGDIGSVAKLGLVSTSALADLSNGGATISAAVKNTSIEAVIDAMSQEQIVRTLAQPNLTTVSGQSANFLVGGEFPIPISANMGQISVQFKTYGISLTFLPTVLSSGQINLKVRPEVSYLTDQGAISFSNGIGGTVSIPALNVRRAETTVQLGSGESFAIAGLMRDVATSSNSLTPFLSDVPVLGALFRSDSFKHEQTELVIIVTPYIVRPASSQKMLHTPDENFKGVDDAEKFFAWNRQKGDPAPETPKVVKAAPVTAASLLANGGGAVDDVSNIYQAKGLSPLGAPTPLDGQAEDESDDIRDLTPSLTVRSRPGKGYSSSLQLPSDVKFQE